MYRHFLFGLILFLGLGCSTFQRSVALREVDRKLVSLQENVRSVLPIGLRATSPNGREYLSKYFVPYRDDYKEADTAPRRWFAQIIVLGDRRPYDIEIYVKRERRVIKRGTLTYVPDGLDLRIASNLRTKLEEALTQRREDTNIIDDFRAF